jgi:hypothetical protein
MRERQKSACASRNTLPNRERLCKYSFQMSMHSFFFVGNELDLAFSFFRITFSMKDSKKRVFNFEIAEGQPEGGVLVAKGDRGTVRVPKGLDAHTSGFFFRFMFYVTLTYCFLSFFLSFFRPKQHLRQERTAWCCRWWSANNTELRSVRCSIVGNGPGNISQESSSSSANPCEVNDPAPNCSGSF